MPSHAASVVTAKGKAREDATPAYDDREVVLLFMIFGEAHGLMHAINGFIFGNLPSPVMTAGERVRRYVLGMRNEKDIHGPLARQDGAPGAGATPT